MTNCALGSKYQTTSRIRYYFNPYGDMFKFVIYLNMYSYEYTNLLIIFATNESSPGIMLRKRNIYSIPLINRDGNTPASICKQLQANKH